MVSQFFGLFSLIWASFNDLFSSALSMAGKPPDFSLKWVDDTHALAIYGSPYAGNGHPSS